LWRQAVGIVLSGVGSDGSLGVGKIKEHGGVTLAQAEFDHVAQGARARTLRGRSVPPSSN
jgi:two-component system CheB/CheR fusion protein